MTARGSCSADLSCWRGFTKHLVAPSYVVCTFARHWTRCSCGVSVSEWEIPLANSEPVGHSFQWSSCARVGGGRSPTLLFRFALPRPRSACMHVWSGVCTGSFHAAPRIPQPADRDFAVLFWAPIPRLPSVLCHSHGCQTDLGQEDLKTRHQRHPTRALLPPLRRFASPSECLHRSCRRGRTGRKASAALGTSSIGGKPLTAQLCTQRQQRRTASVQNTIGKPPTVIRAGTLQASTMTRPAGSDTTSSCSLDGSCLRELFMVCTSAEIKISADLRSKQIETLGPWPAGRGVACRLDIAFCRPANGEGLPSAHRASSFETRAAVGKV